MRSDLPHSVSQRVADRRRFLLAEPVPLGVPDGDLEAGEATRPVVVQHVQRCAEAAAGHFHGQGGEAVLTAAPQQVGIPVGVGRDAAVRAADPFQIAAAVDRCEGVVPGDVDSTSTPSGRPGARSAASAAARSAAAWSGCHWGSVGTTDGTSSLTGSARSAAIERGAHPVEALHCPVVPVGHLVVSAPAPGGVHRPVHSPAPVDGETAKASRAYTRGSTRGSSSATGASTSARRRATPTSNSASPSCPGGATRTRTSQGSRRSATRSEWWTTITSST